MLVGHQKQWQFLKKSAELDKIPHGLLFSGQEQLGKRTLAKEFIKLLNCFGGDAGKKPCGVCRSCQDIDKGIHSDFTEVTSPFGKEEIQISQIRDLIWKLSLRSYSGSFKAAVIDNAHKMTREAQSCLLKLLEEPKGRTLLILISSSPETLLPTILSRVQEIKFFPVPLKEIREYMAVKKMTEEKIKYFSEIAFGRPGKAIEFLAQPQKSENQKKIISDLIKMADSDLASRFQYAKTMVEAEEQDLAENLPNLLLVWASYLRNILLNRLRDPNKTTRQGFGFYSLPKLAKIISNVESTSYLLSTTNINQKLAFELLLLEM